MKKIHITLLTIAGIMLLSGCGTCMRSSARGIYPATKTDCRTFLYAGLSDGSIVNECNSQVQRGITRTCYTIVGVVDLPLSVVSDTLLLPYDLMKKEYPLEQDGGGYAPEPPTHPSTAPSKSRATP